MSTELTFSPDAPEAETLAAIAALEITVPRLSREQLERAAFTHFNLTRPKGTPLAEAIVGDFADKDKARVWVELRCIEMLRTRIALIHPQLTEIAAKSGSSAVKAAIIDKIYSAISNSFPQLTQAAAQACARRKQQLAIPPQQPPTPASAAGVQIDFEVPELEEEELDASQPEALSSEPNTHKEDTQQQIPSGAFADSDQMRVRQLTQLALLCLTDVRDYLVPAAAEEDIGGSIPSPCTSLILNDLLLDLA